MKYFKRVLFSLFLISITTSIFGSIDSRIINNTNKPFLAFWVANPCIFTHDHVTQVCHHKVIGAHGGSGFFQFKSGQTNLQIKVMADCRRNYNDKINAYSFYCPSTGDWALDGSGKPTCKLIGSDRDHVKDIVINDFNAYKDSSSNCKHRHG
ncbi:MAG: hypothetical protein OXC48_00725 [Endozoicomonadaceae bacterium]|nr:hypothetical protein [Endozoicomonadaceae bacterium]